MAIKAYPIHGETQEGEDVGEPGFESKSNWHLRVRGWDAGGRKEVVICEHIEVLASFTLFFEAISIVFLFMEITK